MAKELTVFNPENIKSKIYSIRGVQVMLDADLAELYNVKIKVLNQAAKRNNEQFPLNFMFQLTDDEVEIFRPQTVTSSRDSLRSQIATLENKRGKHRKWFAFSKFDKEAFNLMNKLGLR